MYFLRINLSFSLFQSIFTGETVVFAVFKVNTGFSRLQGILFLDKLEFSVDLRQNTSFIFVFQGIFQADWSFLKFSGVFFGLDTSI